MLFHTLQCSVMFLLISATPARASGGLSGTAAPPEGLARKDCTGLRAAYEAERHAARRVDGGYRARNPGQRWRTDFDGRGFRTEPDSGDWTWGLELSSYGFAGHERAVTVPSGTSAEGKRVVYEWDECLDEWYENDRRGLEHGFTVHRRPPREGGSELAQLILNLSIRGGLRPEVTAGGRDVRFLDEQSTAVLTYTGLTVLDAEGRELKARFDRSDLGLRLSIDELGARYPLTVDPIAQQAYIKASNPDVEDLFGYGAAISGDTVVIGAHWEDSDADGVDGDQGDNSASSAGAAYVFVRNGTTWSQQAYLKAFNSDAGDEFGRRLSICGDTIVVGSHEEDSGATGVGGDESDNSAADAGAVYVFVRNGTTWSQQAYLKASNTDPGDRFGQSASICGDTIVVGAPHEDSPATGINGNQTVNGASGAGAAYVFVRSGTTWSQEAYLKASNTDPIDWFGLSVSVSGDTIVVGAPGEDSAATGVNGDQNDDGTPYAGAAYVFDLDLSPAVPFCFGDGQGTPCPCGNDNDGSVASGQAGCANGSSPGGAALDAAGSSSLLAADLVMTAVGLPTGEPGLFFQGDNAVNGGSGNVFGDGLRCAGGAVVRLGVRFADGSGQVGSTGIDIGVTGGVAPGDTRRYQYWYRDPAGSPCGSQFNLTNGLTLTWTP